MAVINDFRNLYFVRDWHGEKDSFSFIRASSKKEIEIMIESVIKKLYPEDEREMEMKAIHIIKVEPVTMKTLRKYLNIWLKIEEK